ncbi:MAG: YciI family protein [Alphaproteobacteria bacterium]|nr:YciI family protein [Alphaproteobacteria bacterium]
MLHIVRLHDKPNMQDARETYMDAHLAWIEKNRSFVLLAGSLREAPGVSPVGGLWVVDAESKDDVLEKIKTDPFWANGIRADVDVFFWGMASDDMKELPSVMASLRMKIRG